MQEILSLFVLADPETGNDLAQTMQISFNALVDILASIEELEDGPSRADRPEALAQSKRIRPR
jgi:hypothetical protein